MRYRRIYHGSLTPHEPWDDCRGMHCYSHHIDEAYPPGRRPYLVCGECFHVYLTRRDLRRAYVRGYDDMMRSTPSWVGTGELPAGELPAGAWPRRGRPGRWDHIVGRARVRITRARTIGFCPHCIHDL